MKSRLPLILILLIALAAPLSATLLFYFWRPAQFTYSGEILPPSPPPPLAKINGALFAPDEWRGRWHLAQIAPAACDAQCRRRLCIMRQLRLMVNAKRIRRVWLITDDDAPPSSLQTSPDCGLGAQARAEKVDVISGVLLLRADAAARDWLGGGGGVYVVDERGRAAMRFADGASIYNMRDDVSRLLKY
jgi:hypothetical protein